jgi:hypothetical protein
MKDGTNTDMPRGAVSKLWSGDFRMGEPTMRNGIVSSREFIACWRQTQGTETSKYLEEEKENSIPWVAASETGRAQTKRLASWGCRTLYTELQKNELDEATWKGPL